MIRINKIYDAFNSEYNTAQSGFFRPDADFVPAIHAISLDIYNKLVGITPREQKIKDWLAPFLRMLNIAVLKKPAYDYILSPDDYKNYAASRVIFEKEKNCGQPECDLLNGAGQCIPFADVEEDFFPATAEYEEWPVTLLDSSKWASMTKHKTNGPTAKRPFLKQQSDGFMVLPRDLGVIVLDYYISPVEPVFNYDSVGTAPDVFLQFKDAGSTHLQWPETLLPVFLYHLGKKYGLTIQNQLILQVRQIDKLFE